MDYNSVWIYFMSAVILITLITTIASCLCCRKQEMKNELLGLEGMVKLTNPEDTLVSQSTVISVDPKSSGSDNESKRTSNAPHRSLPDIPIAEPVGDNNSELYATVGDKVQEQPQGRSPTLSLKKQASVSQHSSISQADDVSSPYARVRSPPHAYDKLRRAEHPYAQVVQPGTSNTAQAAVQIEDELRSSLSRRESNQSLLGEREGPAAEIPAASAIAGRISASQDLPYMTPPIVQQPIQHFSGDSQDSSKGYTSISVREPLANLIPQNQTAAHRRQVLGDSHYATVSDDSDEMYAAIDDPNNQGDLYTSGSETYAQIQPPNALTVSVEINMTAHSNEETVDPPPASTSATNPVHKRLSSTSGLQDDTPIPPPVDSLRAQSFAHSRQASSSSCTSSVGNLGSPKPEKRQANSPLPPTPKNLKQQSTNFFSNTNLTTISSTGSAQSGRNSVASVIEYNNINKQISKENLMKTGEKSDSTTSVIDASGTAAAKKKQSPSKDLEGMYAKVMKKNKLSNLPSQNSSPVPSRKLGTNFEDIVLIDNSNIELYVSDPDISKEINIPEFMSCSVHASPSKHSIKSTPILDNNYETIDKKRGRSNSYHNKDPGYETIPGDRNISNNHIEMNRKSADYAQIVQRSNRTSTTNNFLAQGIHKVSQNSLEIFHGVDKFTAPDTEPGYESLPDARLMNLNINDPGYETLNRNRNNSDSDPNYEILRPTNQPIKDLNDGYSSIKTPKKENLKTESETEDNDSTAGYSSIKEKKDIDLGYSIISQKTKAGPSNHDYASICESAKEQLELNICNNNNSNNDDEGSDIYSSIPSSINPSFLSVNDGNSSSHNYSTISETAVTASPGYSSISETRTTPSTDGDASTSSPDNHIEYGKHNSITNDGSSSKMSSNNYESLTGSESDPNYESVKYLDAKENPYERLHNESNSSPLQKRHTLSSNGSLNTPTKSESNTQTPTPPPPPPSTGSMENVGVGDYFQV